MLKLVFSKIVENIFGHNKALCLLLCIVAISFTDCRNSRQRDFDRLLVSLAAEDGVVDYNDWQKIVEYISSNAAHFSQFMKDDEIDAESVKQYISDMFANRRPSKDILFDGAGTGREFLTVKLYLERSGSMIPYDSSKGRGEFKNSIVSILNSLPGNPEDNSIFIVNDGVFKYPKTFRDFITDKNIFETTKGIGNASYTDFGCILDSVLNRNGADDISILVSDMIYSTADVGVVNTDKIFSEAKSTTQAIMKNMASNKSILFVKLNSSFIGTYYPYNQPHGVQYNGMRPYYIMIVGDNANIKRLASSDKYKRFSQLTDLKGFEHMTLFTHDKCYTPYYSILLSDNDMIGRMRADHKKNDGDAIHALTSVTPDKDSGVLQIVLSVNFNDMFVEESYLTDINNYDIESDDPVEITSIKAIEKSDITQNNREAMEKATHRVVLRLKKFSHDQKVTIRLKNKFQQWIIDSNSDDDSRPDAADRRFASTTFSLQPLMEGIYDSYAALSNESLDYFVIDLFLDK